MSEKLAKEVIAAAKAALPGKKHEKGKAKTGFGKTVDPAVGKATQIKKGQRLPGAGRPRKSPMTDALRRQLERKLTPEQVEKSGLPKGSTVADLAAMGVIQEVVRGKVDAFDAVADRTDGPVPKEISGPEGGPLEIEATGNLYEDAKLVTQRLRDRLAKRRSVQSSES